MFSHLLSDDAQPDTGEVVDREASVLRVVHGEHLLVVFSHGWVFEPLRQLLQPHLFHHFIHKNFDENSARRRGVVLVHLDHREHSPRQRIARQQMTEEPSDVAKPVRLVAMDCLVVCGEGLLEVFAPHAIEFAETFPDQTVEI